MIDHLIDRVIAREGGYVNHPADRGGPTNMGITLATLASYRAKQVTAEDVKALTRQEAATIYRLNYWIRPGFVNLKVAPQVAEMVFDAAVHHGVGAATRFLQRAVGVKDDGVLGPVTRRAVGDYPGRKLAARFLVERAEELGRIITRNPSQAAFAHGWFRRLGEFILMIPEV